MARARNIKPAFFMNEHLAELDPLARLLFIGPWCIADKEGRLEDRPKRIKAEILPYDDCNIDKLLEDLGSAPESFITRYEINGEKYILVNNFKKHQNPHKNEKASEIPAPGDIEKFHEITGEVQEMHPTNRADSLNLIPDSGLIITDNPIPEKTAIDVFNQNIHPITPIELEKLTDWLRDLPEELVIEAIKEAVNNGVRKMSYIEAILNNWKSDGITTIEGFEAKQRERGDPRGRNQELDPTAKTLEFYGKMG